MATKLSMLLASAISAFAGFSANAQDKMPGFDILVGDLDVTKQGLSVTKVTDITQRPSEYDNQPHFLPSGNMMLYTRVYQDEKGEQTESHIYNLVTKQSSRLTNTDASEYSPTLMPSQTQFSVIKAFDDKQKLWQYPLTSLDGKPVELLKEVNPVGYHAWVNEKEVIMFVLGEPHTLQLANIDTGESQIIDKDIGASLYKIPNSKLMSYSVNVGTAKAPKWQVKSFNAETKQTAKITDLPEGAYYYGWTGDRQLIAAQETKLFSYRLSEHSKWQQFADVSEVCPKGISRITTNAQNTKIAMVCAR